MIPSTESRQPCRSPFFAVRDLLLAGLFGGIYYVSYAYAMSFGSAAASAFWLPDAVLLSALLMRPPLKWWVYLLIPLPIRLLLVRSSMPEWFLVGCYLNDSLKALLCALLLISF